MMSDDAFDECKTKHHARSWDGKNMREGCTNQTKVSP